MSWLKRVAAGAAILAMAVCGTAQAYDPKARQIKTDTGEFDNNLTAADDTVQDALETLDELTIGAGDGDITAVGDIIDGAAFTAAVPGKTLTFNNATSGTVTLQTVVGALGTQTVSLPAGTGTVALTSDLHAAVTLGADADVLLGLTTQQLTLDSQAINVVLAGPGTGSPGDPTFRALVDDDIPNNITITETDPNALLTAGTDNVKDTHIDWGTGASQVSTDDVPQGSTNLYSTLTNIQSALTSDFHNIGGTDATGTDTLDDLSNNSIDDLSDVTITTAAAAHILVRNSGNTAWVNVALGGDGTIGADGSLTIGSDKIALGTDTTGNYVAGATASGGLALTGTEGGTLGVLLPAATNGLSTTTYSGSGLELLAGGLAIIQGCDDGAPLEWNETDDRWQCGTDNSGGGTANILDLGDDGGNDSTDLVEIATTGDTNSIFTESAADKLLIAVGNDWPKADLADTATALAADPANCASSGLAGGITAAGTAEGCVTPHAGTNIAADLEEEVTEGSLADSTIVTGDIKDAEVAQADINDTATLAGNPAYGDSSVYFATTGLIFEGETSDNIELLLIGADPVTADKTLTLPAETGTLCSTGSICTGYQAALGFTAANSATTMTVAGTTNEVTSSAGAQDLSTNRTWTIGLPDDVVITTSLTAPNTGLHLLDSNASHDLIIKPGSDITTADKTLTITTGDADRTLTMTGDASITGTNTGDQTTVSGNAGTATALAADPSNCATATHFAVGVTAAGTAECEAISDDDVPDSITIAAATLAATVTVVDGTDATSFPAIFDSVSGSLAAKTDAALTYNASTGALSATSLLEGATGVPNTGDNLSVFAATTSAQLTGVLSDEDGTGTCGTGAVCIGGHTHPASEVSDATATPTASKIPIADGSGKLDGWISASSTTVSGITEAAIASEVTTGTDAARAVTPDALAGSTIFGVKVVEVTAFDWTTDTATGDGKFYFYVPAALNGMNLISVHAQVITAGTTGTTNVDLARCATVATGNVCSGTVADMLSTNLTIDTGEDDSGTAAAAAAIDATNDDVATGQVIRVDVDAVHTTAAKGLIVTMEFKLP